MVTPNNFGAPTSLHLVPAHYGIVTLHKPIVLGHKAIVPTHFYIVSANNTIALETIDIATKNP